MTAFAQSTSLFSVTERSSESERASGSFFGFFATPTCARIETWSNAQKALPTNAGLEVADEEPLFVQPSAALAELRSLTGFTWEQLAELFEVSRRSLHFWASGKRQSGENEQHLQSVLLAIRSIDRGSAAENRALLMRAEHGVTPLDLLRKHDYEELVERIGRGAGRPTRIALKLSPDALAARRPLTPDALLDTVPEKPRPSSRSRVIATFPIARKKRDE